MRNVLACASSSSTFFNTLVNNKITKITKKKTTRKKTKKTGFYSNRSYLMFVVASSVQGRPGAC